MNGSLESNSGMLAGVLYSCGTVRGKINSHLVLSGVIAGVSNSEDLAMNGVLESDSGVLIGKLYSCGTISGTINSHLVLSGIVAMTPNLEDYVGNYTIIPDFTQQVMPTNDKHMTDDVTIESIPYSEVANQSGGLTINIGG